MFLKNCCHFEKNIKVDNMCSKVLDNILAMLYSLLTKNWKNKTYFFEIKLFFQEMCFHLYFNILFLIFLFEENMMKSLNLQTHISL
jgi:hypothetical protein